MLKEDILLREGILKVAELMAVAAKTAPKARGIDNITSVVLSSRDELSRLADKMDELADELGSFFKRDAENIRRSEAVVLIGIKIVKYGLKSPKEYKVDIDTVLSIINLGIALGSAVKIASILNVDNRIMYSVGLAAQKLGLINAEYVYGIPLSAKSKNIYFDREQ